MPAASHPVRFGLFEVDIDERVLTKNGRRIRLQNQPFRLLEMLLKHPGEIVTREQLREALWSADTFVDFDRSLNAAAAKLRQALGDSADNPRFIETVAKRGYRFIAPSDAAQSETKNSAVLESPASIAPRAPQSDEKLRGRFRFVYGVALIAVVAVSMFIWNRRPKSSDATVTQLTFDSGLTIDPAISPDGQWLAYASDRADGHHLNLWIQRLTPRGSPVQLTSGEQEARQPSFSPDGSHIVFSCATDTGSAICAMPSTGGTPVRLTERGSVPRFSPDGKWISFQVGQDLTSPITGFAMGQCYVIPSAGGVPRRIAPDAGQITNAVWSPDSEHLLVYKFSAKVELRDWYLVSALGGPSKRTGLFESFHKNGLSIDANRTPRLSQWQRGYLIFSATHGDGTNIWRIPASNEATATGKAERLTLGTAIETSPFLSTSGDLFFESLEQLDNIWSLPLDADRGVVRGEFTPLTQGPFDVTPSISGDGRVLAFAAAREKNVSSENTQIRLRDIGTNQETVVSDGATPEHSPHISSDGSLIAALEWVPGGRNGSKGTRILRLEDGLARLIPETVNSWGFSHDNRRLLYTLDDHVIRCLDIRAQTDVFQLAHPNDLLYQASFAPDDRFIAVENVTAPGNRDSLIFIVPVKDNVPARFEDWIAIEHTSLWDDKPRWAPNGKLLYFLSDRDGRLCLWAQHLDPDSKRPLGKPFAVRHFHSSRADVRNVGLGLLEIGIARDKAVFGIGEVRGNIWIIGRRP